MLIFSIGAKGVIERQGVKFMYKETEPYEPINGRQQDRHFPAIENLDYNN